MPGRLVVIGGDGAGMSAAAQARRRDPSLEIVALEKGPYVSYSACGIPHLVGGEVTGGSEALVARTAQAFRDDLRIDVRLRHEAVGIDLDAGKVEVRNHEHGRSFAIGFDALHVATGARPLRPDLPGIDLPSVHGVQTLGDADDLLARVRAIDCQRVVVVGGGYIGLEMAEAFVRWGAEVTVIDSGAHVMATFDPDMAERIEDAMRRHGITLQLGVAVEGFEPGRVITADGPVEADLVVLGLGVAPASALAEEAGLELGARKAIRVDRRQQTSAEGVWAAGDCAETFHRVTQRSVHIALGTVANKTGRVAGINLAGGYATFEGVVGTAVTRICSAELARTGLNEREAADAGFKAVARTIHSTTRSGYLPSARPLTVKMLAECRSGRVLGCQIVGEEGAAKRIDVVATAITARMTVSDVLDLDLSYAPPVSPLWDPVQVAARQLLGAI
jgi:NADPH-dependent 2,4-dienoyl-CoA reductase/sulfur reductase-like enzyme